MARQLLLDLPVHLLRTDWTKYIIAPVQGVLDFRRAARDLQTGHQRCLRGTGVRRTRRLLVDERHVRGRPEPGTLADSRWQAKWQASQGGKLRGKPKTGESDGL